MQINKVKESFPLIATVSIAMLLGSLAAIEIIERVEAVLANALLPAALRNSNIVKYFCGLVVFVLSFFGTYLLVYLQPPKYMKRLADARLDKTAFGWWTLMAALAAAVILLLRRFVFELNDNGVIISDITLHRIPVIAVVPMIVVWGAFCVWLDRSGKDVPLAAAWVCYGVCVIFGFVAGLVMNIFHADIHHGVAYIESIYNVYHMVPYTRTTTGIYGHYGLLLAPLLHLFGDGNLAMMGMIAGLQALCVILSIYCVHNITDKNWMRILCVLASCVTVFTMRTKNYWQIQPHRVVFPLAVIAYVIHLAKTNSWNKKKILVGYGLCVLACLWNTESGLFCSAAFALAVIAHELQFSRWYAARMLGLYTMHICGILGSMCAAILIVNGYNFLCGYRSLVLADFFFPLFVSDYMSGVLKLDIQVDPDAWVFSLALFASLLLVGLYYTTFFAPGEELRKHCNAKLAPVAVATAILGLSNYSYYANRAAYLNLDIIIQIACIGNCLLYRLGNVPDISRKKCFSSRDVIRTFGRLVAVMVVAVLALQTVVFTPRQIKEKHAAGHYSLSEYYSSCEQLAANIPADTFAFGGGISLFYNELGWDTVGHYGDFSDLFVGGMTLLEKITSDAVEQDAFVVFHGTGSEYHVRDRILELEPGFVLIRELDMNGTLLQYYEKQ